MNIGDYIAITFPAVQGAFPTYAKIINIDSTSFYISTDGIDCQRIPRNSNQLTSIPISENILLVAGFKSIDPLIIQRPGISYVKVWCLSTPSGKPIFVGYDGSAFYYIFTTPQNTYADLHIDVIDELQYHVMRNQHEYLIMTLVNTAINKQKMLDYLNSKLNPNYYIMIGSTTNGIRYQSGNPSNIDFDVMMSCDIFTSQGRPIVTITNFQQKTATICIKIGTYVIKYNYGADIANLKNTYQSEFRSMTNAESTEVNRMYDTICAAIEFSLSC